jgi:hypothetical protein
MNIYVHAHTYAQELPQEFGGMRSLQRLWLDDNKLTYLPEGFGMLTALVSF